MATSLDLTPYFLLWRSSARRADARIPAARLSFAIPAGSCRPRAAVVSRVRGIPRQLLADSVAAAVGRQARLRWLARAQIRPIPVARFTNPIVQLFNAVDNALMNRCLKTNGSSQADPLVPFVLLFCE